MSAPRTGLHRLLLLASLGLALLPCAHSTEIETRSPIINFKIPRFAPDGRRIALLQGSKGWSYPDGHYEIENMVLFYFGAKKLELPETVLKSGFARYFPERQYAEGEKGMECQRGETSMAGDRWTYDRNQEKMMIDGHVKVIYPGQIGDILE